ncbi:MAG TPA: MaoC family dehydratase N-terminal domain-containing protein [Pseudomonadales bacterium]
MLDVDDLKRRFLDLEFDSKDFVIAPDNAFAVARASGETRPEFTDPSHPNVQATPAIIASLASGRHLPIHFPDLGGIPMDGGKAVTCLHPVPLGTKVNGRTHLHDIYAKSGRSGRMIFLVSRMEIRDATGKHLATSDSRMVIRERPEA